MQKKSSIQLPDFSKMHMVVIGDVMTDRYINGRVRRISPEAPVPVVEMTSQKSSAGGAANVAVNLISMGASVTLLSIVGNDEEADVLEEMLKYKPRLSTKFRKHEGRRTTVKTRIMSGSQHLLRIDSEDTRDIDASDEAWILQQMKEVAEAGKIDGVIMQDYNKGIFTPALIHQVIEFTSARNISTFVDPKEKNFFAFKGCTVFKPNKKEAMEACRTEGSNLDAMDIRFRKELNHTLTVITLGSDGIYMNDGTSSHIFSTSQRDIADVCGAGDTVISVISLCYAAGMGMVEIANTANAAGGQVCEHPGVVAVDVNKLQAELQ